jgi:hypothetical protein
MPLMKKGPRRELVIAVLGLLLAALGAWSARERVRTVDVITLFAGGVAAGVALGSAIQKVRAAKESGGA